MNDFRREEQTVTTVRHLIATPANYAEVQKLLRVVVNDMTGGAGVTGLGDDQIWYEVGDEELAICYEKPATTPGHCLLLYAHTPHRIADGDVMCDGSERRP